MPIAAKFKTKIRTRSLVMGARRGQRELARLVGQCRVLLADPTLTGGDYSIDLIMVVVEIVQTLRLAEFFGSSRPDPM